MNTKSKDGKGVDLSVLTEKAIEETQKAMKKKAGEADNQKLIEELEAAGPAEVPESETATLPETRIQKPSKK